MMKEFNFKKLLSKLVCVMFCISAFLPTSFFVGNFAWANSTLSFQIRSEDGKNVEATYVDSDKYGSVFEISNTTGAITLVDTNDEIAAICKIKEGYNCKDDIKGSEDKTYVADLSNFTATIEDLDYYVVYYYPNLKLDGTAKYSYIEVRNDKGFSTFLIFKTGYTGETIDKTLLEKAIQEAPQTGYHKTDDRYNGNETSQKGFWEEYKTAYANAEKESKSSAATKESVARALSDLQNAISKLIPSTQANTTKLYEALQDLLTENTGYTAVSWDNYVKAKETAQSLFDGLFAAGEDGKRVATDQNTAAKQREIENAATVLTAAKEDLLQSKGLEERIALWKEASTWLLAQNQQVQQGQYTEASTSAWNTAFASLQKAKQEGYQTQSRYDAYTSSVVALSTAYYKLQDSNTEDITVHVRVADNFGAMFPEYAIQDPATATFDQNVTLGSGNKTISALLSAMGYDDTPKEKTPSTGTQYGEGWKNPEVMVYINGTLAVNRSKYIDSWQGYIGKTEDGKLNISQLYFDVQLHDKDEIVILRALGPGYNYYGDIAAGVAGYNFYYGSLALLNIKENVIEVEAGKTFTVNVEKTTAAAEAKKRQPVPQTSVFSSVKNRRQKMPQKQHRHWRQSVAKPISRVRRARPSIKRAGIVWEPSM